jgi:uncharacterized membrane protein
MTEESVLDEHFKKTLQLPRKSYAIMALATVFIVLVSSLHGMTEAWAWELARNLITVDGLILGFIVFGATVLSRQSFNKASYESMIEETVDRLLLRASEYEKSKKTLQEWVEEEYLPTWKTAFYGYGFQQGYMVGSLSTSAVLILSSIGLAFCLFGVNDKNVNAWPYQVLFLFLYYASIYCFVSGVYLAYHLITVLLERTMIPTEKPSRAITRILGRKMKELAKQKDSS